MGVDNIGICRAMTVPFGDSDGDDRWNEQSSHNDQNFHASEWNTLAVCDPTEQKKRERERERKDFFSVSIFALIQEEKEERERERDYTYPRKV